MEAERFCCLSNSVHTHISSSPVFLEVLKRRRWRHLCYLTITSKSRDISAVSPHFLALAICLGLPSTDDGLAALFARISAFPGSAAVNSRIRSFSWVHVGPKIFCPIPTCTTAKQSSVIFRSTLSFLRSAKNRVCCC